MATNPGVSSSRKVRLRVIEGLMLSGAGAQEIHELTFPQFGVTYGTIRNDICDINKAHRKDLTKLNELEGREKYLASVRHLRRKAMSGWNEVGAQGEVKIKGRDYKLVHALDKEIASLSGVTLTAGDRTITLNMEKARGYLELIFSVVFKHVESEDTRQLIMDDIEQIKAEDE